MEVDLHEIYGQPFGAGHAVPNFCRVSEWIARCLTRLFGLCLDHVFDDFFWIDRRSTAKVALLCVQKAFALLGFSLDPSKSQSPESTCAVLGVIFNTCHLSKTHRLVTSGAKTH